MLQRLQEAPPLPGISAAVMRRDYDFGKELGRGSFGTVYKVQRKADGHAFVCKQIHLQGMSKKAREEANQEVTLLRKVSSGSEYIVQYIESFLEVESLHIVMEYCDSGDLGHYIKARAGQPIAEPMVWKFLVQIGYGLRWLHANRILHRDIKPLNVFLVSVDNVRLGDLGVARVLSHNTNFACTFVGTPYYLSPELCEERPYNEKSDVWAYGCVVYEMCAMKHPFDAKNHAGLLIKILRGQYAPVSADYSPDVRALIDLCMRRDYTKRPTLEELLAGSLVEPWVERLGLALPSLPIGADDRYVGVDRARRPAAPRPPPSQPPLGRPQAAGLPPRREVPVPALVGARVRRANSGARQDAGPTKSQVICAPPAVGPSTAQVIRNAPARGGQRPGDAPRTSKERPSVRGVGERAGSGDQRAEERRRNAAREVADLPDFVVPVGAPVRRNAPTVQQLMRLERESTLPTEGSSMRQRALLCADSGLEATLPPDEVTLVPRVEPDSDSDRPTDQAYGTAASRMASVAAVAPSAAGGAGPRLRLLRPVSDATGCTVFDDYEDSILGAGDFCGDLGDSLAYTLDESTQGVNGIGSDVVIEWGVLAEQGAAASAQEFLDDMQAAEEEPQLVSPQAPEPACVTPPAVDPQARLRRRAENLQQQISRLYADVMKDMDPPARAVWEQLYGMFRAKMALDADLSDDDQSEIERYIFEQLPTESTDLIFKVYRVLHLEQELEGCQRLLGA